MTERLPTPAPVHILYREPSAGERGADLLVAPKAGSRPVTACPLELRARASLPVPQPISSTRDGSPPRGRQRGFPHRRCTTGVELGAECRDRRASFTAIDCKRAAAKEVVLSSRWPSHRTNTLESPAGMLADGSSNAAASGRNPARDSSRASACGDASIDAVRMHRCPGWA